MEPFGSRYFHVKGKSGRWRKRDSLPSGTASAYTHILRTGQCKVMCVRVLDDEPPINHSTDKPQPEARLRRGPSGRVSRPPKECAGFAVCRLRRGEVFCAIVSCCCCWAGCRLLVTLGRAVLGVVVHALTLHMLTGLCLLHSDRTAQKNHVLRPQPLKLQKAHAPCAPAETVSQATAPGSTASGS